MMVLLFLPDSAEASTKTQTEAESVEMAYDISPFTKKGYADYYTVEHKESVYDVYLGSVVDSVDHYKDLIKGIKSLKSTDTIVIHMANYGGSVMTGVQIINAMKVSKAKVIVELEGPSYSMGALLTCAADDIIYHDYTYLMFHTFSGGFQGKASDSEKHMKAIAKMIVDVLQSECKPKGILTDRQIEDIMNGVDVYVHPKDINSG